MLFERAQAYTEKIRTGPISLEMDPPIAHRTAWAGGGRRPTDRAPPPHAAQGFAVVTTHRVVFFLFVWSCVVRARPAGRTRQPPTRPLARLRVLPLSSLPLPPSFPPSPLLPLVSLFLCALFPLPLPSLPLPLPLLYAVCTPAPVSTRVPSIALHRSFPSEKTHGKETRSEARPRRGQVTRYDANGDQQSRDSRAGKGRSGRRGEHRKGERGGKQKQKGGGKKEEGKKREIR